MAIEMENEKTFSDYLSIAKRRWAVILSVFILSSLIASLYILTLAPKYHAEGFITVNSPAISKSLIGDELNIAKYVGEHLDKVKQKVLSRENLVRLDEKYDLFPGIIRPSWIADAVRDSITLETEKRSRDGGNWGPQVTVGLTIGFDNPDPQVTYDVVNDIITQLLDQNVKDNRERATETAEFLTAELNKFQTELDLVENKVAAYKQKHSSSLPEHQALHMTSLEQLRATLRSYDSEVQSTQEELRYLDVELATAKASLNNSAGSVNGVNAQVSELEMAVAELERAKVLYKDTHPTIRILKRKVALLEQQEVAPVAVETKKVDVAGELAIAKIQSQIEAAKSRLVSISQEKKNTRAEIQRVKKQIVNIPQVESGLASLLRDYENAKRKYDEVKAKQVNAKVAEGLELNNKTERLVLLESPEYPEYNQNMRKSKAIPLAFLGSLGLGFGFAFLLEMFDKRVRGQGALISVIHAKPLVVIPYINTQAELKHKKNIVRAIYIVLTILIAFIAALAIAHFFVMPLESLPLLESVLEA